MWGSPHQLEYEQFEGRNHGLQLFEMLNIYLVNEQTNVFKLTTSTLNKLLHTFCVILKLVLKLSVCFKI